jgi:hypothetical protein
MERMKLFEADLELCVELLSMTVSVTVTSPCGLVGRVAAYLSNVHVMTLLVPI